MPARSWSVHGRPAVPVRPVVARLSVLGAWRGGGVLRRARLADAGVSLACELVAFLARPASRACRSWRWSLGLGGAGGRIAAIAFLRPLERGSRPALTDGGSWCAFLVLGLARVSVAVGVCRAVRPVLAVEIVLIVRVRGGAAGALTWRAWSWRDLARLVNGRLGVARRPPCGRRAGRRFLSPEHVGTVEHSPPLAADAGLAFGLLRLGLRRGRVADLRAARRREYFSVDLAVFLLGRLFPFT